MKYINSVLAIGIILIFIPVLGFPIVWKNVLMIALGIWLCGMSFSMRYYKPPVNKPKKRVTKKHATVDSIAEVKNIISAEPAPVLAEDGTSQTISE